MSAPDSLAWALDALSSASKEELQPFSPQISRVFQRLSALLADENTAISSPSPDDFNPLIQQPTCPQSSACSRWSGAVLQNQPEAIDMAAMPCWIDSTASTSFQQSQEHATISLLEYSSASWIDDAVAPTDEPQADHRMSLQPVPADDQDAIRPTASSSSTQPQACGSLMEIDQSSLYTCVSPPNNPTPRDGPLAPTPFNNNIEADGITPGENSNTPDITMDERQVLQNKPVLQAQPDQDHGINPPTVSSRGNSTNAQGRAPDANDALEKKLPDQPQDASDKSNKRHTDFPQRLTKMKVTLQSYLEKSVASAVNGRATWQNEDVRIVDIKVMEGDKSPTFQCRFRRILAIRSLHKEFSEWQGVGNTRLRSKSQNCFVSKGGFSDPRAVRRAISIGKTLHALEKEMGFPTISLLVGTVFWESQRVSLGTVKETIERFKMEEQEFWQLLEQKSTWFEACQEYYSDLGHTQNVGRKIFLREEPRKSMIKRKHSSGERSWSR